MIPHGCWLGSRGKVSLNNGEVCRVDGHGVAVGEEIGITAYVFDHCLEECRGILGKVNVLGLSDVFLVPLQQRSTVVVDVEWLRRHEKHQGRGRRSVSQPREGSYDEACWSLRDSSTSLTAQHAITAPW